MQLSLGSIGHHRHTNSFVQVYNDEDNDGVPDYAALAQEWREMQEDTRKAMGLAQSES